MKRHVAMVVSCAALAMSARIAPAQEEQPGPPGDTWTDEPSETPPAPPAETPPPPSQNLQAQVPAPSAVPPGHWVYTQQYGWVWMPYADQYTYVPPDGYGVPYAYVFYPAYGWGWVAAPWVWGIGPWPYFGFGVAVNFGWYGAGYWRYPGYYHYAPYGPYYARPVPGFGHPVAGHPGVRPAPRYGSWQAPGFVRSAPPSARPAPGAGARPAPHFSGSGGGWSGGGGGGARPAPAARGGGGGHR